MKLVCKPLESHGSWLETNGIVLDTIIRSIRWLEKNLHSLRNRPLNPVCKEIDMMSNGYDLNEKGCNEVFLFLAGGHQLCIVFIQKENLRRNSQIW